jgi:hypothetical protein
LTRASCRRRIPVEIFNDNIFDGFFLLISSWIKLGKHFSYQVCVLSFTVNSLTLTSVGEQKIRRLISVSDLIGRHVQGHSVPQLPGERQPDGQAGGLRDDPRHVRERLLPLQP